MPPIISRCGRNRNSKNFKQNGRCSPQTYDCQPEKKPTGKSSKLVDYRLVQKKVSKTLGEIMKISKAGVIGFSYGFANMGSSQSIKSDAGSCS